MQILFDIIVNSIICKLTDVPIMCFGLVLAVIHSKMIYNSDDMIIYDVKIRCTVDFKYLYGTL